MLNFYGVLQADLLGSLRTAQLPIPGLSLQGSDRVTKGIGESEDQELPWEEAGMGKEMRCVVQDETKNRDLALSQSFIRLCTAPSLLISYGMTHGQVG
jgi:hypothetical protein